MSRKRAADKRQSHFCALDGRRRLPTHPDLPRRPPAGSEVLWSSRVPGSSSCSLSPPTPPIPPATSEAARTPSSICDVFLVFFVSYAREGGVMSSGEGWGDVIRQWCKGQISECQHKEAFSKLFQAASDALAAPTEALTYRKQIRARAKYRFSFSFITWRTNLSCSGGGLTRNQKVTEAKGETMRCHQIKAWLECPTGTVAKRSRSHRESRWK